MAFTAVQEDIQLRALEFSDADALWDCLQRNRAYLQAWIDWVGHCQSQDQVLDYIQECIDGAERQESLTMAIVQQNRLIGIISLQGWNRQLNLAELGFWIEESMQGKGYIRTAIGLMLRFGFGELKLQKVELNCAANNTRVIRLLQYLNFKIEGVLRRSTLGKGLLTDKVVFGLLKEEYSF